MSDNKKKDFIPITRRCWDYDTPENKPNTIPNTNLAQTSHKPNTNLTHKPNTIFEEKNNPHTQPNTIPNTILTQTSHKPNTSVPVLSTILGHKRSILFYIYEQCKLEGKLEIIISISLISNAIKIPIGSINTTIERLIKKGYIDRVKSCSGRNGWKKIILIETLYRDMHFFNSSHKPNTNLTQSSHKPNTEPHTQPNTTPLSNNNNININTIITTDDDLPKEWDEINYDVLIDLGFSKTQLKQLYEINLKNPDKNLIKPEIVQLSIYHLAFGLKYTEKTKAISNPMYVFMGVLRKGQAWIEDGYESVQDITMREHLEQLQREKEQRKARWEMIFELKFEEWFEVLSDEELKKALTADEFKFGKYVNEPKLKTYFRRTKWEEIKTSTQNLPSNATKTHQGTA